MTRYAQKNKIVLLRAIVFKRGNYDDSRFSSSVLKQHGGYLIANKPYEVEITSPGMAVVRGETTEYYLELIEEFRFHAPHIYKFYDATGAIILEYPAPEIMRVDIAQLQPSQFFIDESKLAAVSSFITGPDDIVIPVYPWNGRYIALDGHTRLFFAIYKGYASVNALVSATDDSIWKFVEEAQRRGIYTPHRMKLLSHDEYEVAWNQYCDLVLATGRIGQLPR